MSQVLAAKDAVLALFANTPALAGVRRTWTWPAEEEDIGQEHMALGTVEQTEEWANIRRDAMSVEEAFTISFGLWVFKPGDVLTAARASEERLWQLRDAFSTALRADIQLGGVVRTARISRTRIEEPETVEEGYIAHAVLEITCAQRI
jgi:hypothetical protein